VNERVKRRSDFVETRRGKEKERRTSISRTHSVHLEPSHARRSTHENPVDEMSSFGRVERKDETGSSGEGCELEIETRVEERMIDDGQLFQFSQTLRWSIEREREKTHVSLPKSPSHSRFCRRLEVLRVSSEPGELLRTRRRKGAERESV